jgi:alpha-N-arabinofuranosidase
MKIRNRPRLLVTIILFLFLKYSYAEKFDSNAQVFINCNNKSSWEVDTLLFGRFFEHHGADVYPGMYEQYIINTSFEKWYNKDESSLTPLKDIKTQIVFTDVDSTSGIAYPWEPYNNENSAGYGYSTDFFNSNYSQKITNTEDYTEVGIKQRLALPDYRTGKYNFELYAKSSQSSFNVIIQLVDYSDKTIYAQTSFLISSEWQELKGTLDIGTDTANTKFMNRHGIFELVIIIEESGDIYIDRFTLFPDDAVEGIWNSEAIANLKNIGVTSIRWPGGNFASGYRWKDGIGPVEKREVKPNLAWSGLEPNHVGTDEFLQFCELAELTPLICVGFWDKITPQEAAEWVEYCNGDISTTYGALRAANGHPEPYNVKLWQIGNEVYGSYQIGYATASEYANGYLNYYNAMKAVDPSIKMMTMGRDPGYPSDDDNAWNNTLFDIVGEKMDYLDIHRYVRVPDDLSMFDITHLAEICLTFNNQYEEIISSIRSAAGNKSVDSVKLAVTEWALVSNNHVELPHVDSFANGIFYAGMMNTFFRNGDFMKISCSHDFNLFTQNRAYRNTPVLPRAHVSKMYGDIKASRLLETTTTCETFDMDRDIFRMITLQDIPYIDAVALSNDDKTIVEIFVINRSLTSDIDIVITLDGFDEVDKVIETALFSATGDPMDRESWSSPTIWQITYDSFEEFYNAINIQLPKASLMRITATDLSIVSTENSNDRTLSGFHLYQNYPNPFNPTTTINYYLNKETDVKLVIYDLQGCEIITLVNRKESAGDKSVVWDGLDINGRKISSGIYIYKMYAGNFEYQRKMLYLK